MLIAKDVEIREGGFLGKVNHVDLWIALHLGIEEGLSRALGGLYGYIFGKYERNRH